MPNRLKLSSSYMRQKQTVTEAKKHLVLVMNPGHLDFDDFLDVAKIIVKKAPEIFVTIVTPLDAQQAVPAHKWEVPTLIISFGNLGQFSPKRGRVFQNSPIEKFLQ